MKLSRSKLYFRFRVEPHALNNYYCVVCAVCHVFSFVLFPSPLRSFFHLNLVRNVWTRCSHSRFSSQAMILGVFDRNIGLCCLRSCCNGQLRRLRQQAGGFASSIQRAASCQLRAKTNRKIKKIEKEKMIKIRNNTIIIIIIKIVIWL